MSQPLDTPSARAARTAKWAGTMTKWAISVSTNGKRPGTKSTKRWQLVAFPGPKGGESRGIVDLLAIRRDHAKVGGRFKPGDLFEIILIQVKGGTARDPTSKDVTRLRAVGKHYGAKHVVLASWTKGEGTKFRVMERVSANPERAWRDATAAEVFGDIS